MSIFSDQLSELIQKAGFTLPYLAEQSGFSTALISKIKTGKRLPDDEARMLALFHALRCTPAQINELLSEYRIEKLGRERYQCFSSCQNIFEQLYESPEIIRNVNRNVHYDFQFQPVLSDSRSVNQIIQFLIDYTFTQKDYLRMIIPASFTFLMDYLSTAYSHLSAAGEEYKIEHIIELAPAFYHNSDKENIQSVGSALITLCNCSTYHPYYYYGDSSSNQLYPYLIVNSDYALAINTSFNHALLFHAPEIINSYQTEFQNILTKCSPLMKQMNGSSEYLSYLSNMEAVLYSDTAYTLSRYPCITSCVPLELAQKKIPCNIWNMPEIQSYADFFYGSSHRDISFFTLSGLDSFLETGRIDEIPNELYTPFTRKECIFLLRQLVKEAENGNKTLYLIHESHFHICDSFYCYIFPGNLLTLIWRSQKRENVYYQLLEKSTSNTLIDFIHYLPESELTFSSEESLTLLKEYVEKLS